MPEHDFARQLTTVPDDELAAARRDLHTSIALMPPGSAMRGPAAVYLAAFSAELDRRAHLPAPARPGSP